MSNPTSKEWLTPEQRIGRIIGDIDFVLREVNPQYNAYRVLRDVIGELHVLRGAVETGANCKHRWTKIGRVSEPSPDDPCDFCGTPWKNTFAVETTDNDICAVCGATRKEHEGHSLAPFVPRAAEKAEAPQISVAAVEFLQRYFFETHGLKYSLEDARVVLHTALSQPESPPRLCVGCDRPKWKCECYK